MVIYSISYSWATVDNVSLLLCNDLALHYSNFTRLPMHSVVNAWICLVFHQNLNNPMPLIEHGLHHELNWSVVIVLVTNHMTKSVYEHAINSLLNQQPVLKRQSPIE